MNNKKFDERQLWIRGNIFKHMVIIFVVLLFINAFLSGNDIIWANGFHSSIIIILISGAVGSIEMIFREVYSVDYKQQLFLISVIGGTSLVSLILNIIHVINGEELILNGILTDNGGFLIMSVLIFSIGLCGAIKLLSDKLKKKEKE